MRRQSGELYPRALGDKPEVVSDGVERARLRDREFALGVAAKDALGASSPSAVLYVSSIASTPCGWTATTETFCPGITPARRRPGWRSSSFDTGDSVVDRTGSGLTGSNARELGLMAPDATQATGRGAAYRVHGAKERCASASSPRLLSRLLFGSGVTSRCESGLSPVRRASPTRRTRNSKPGASGGVFARCAASSMYLCVPRGQLVGGLRCSCRAAGTRGVRTASSRVTVAPPALLSAKAAGQWRAR